MIKTITHKSKDITNVWDYLKHNITPDFYVTENRERLFITDFINFKKLLNQSSFILINKEIDVDGVLMIWQGVYNDIKRNYIKISAKNVNIARKLLTGLLWSFNCDLYVKIKKDSDFLIIFREKNFNFLAGRGNELLLYKRKIKRETK